MELSATLKYAPLPNGETYAYRDYGTSENVIVFIHGNFSSSYFFEMIFPKFTNEYRVIAPDLRGYGDSTNHTPALTADELAEDLKLFFDHLKLKNLALLGWSTGGGIVMKFAARHPEYVSKLILYHSVGVQGMAYFSSDEKGTPTKVRAMNIEELKANLRVLRMEPIFLTKDEASIAKILEGVVFNGRNKLSPEVLKACTSETLKQKSYLNSVQILNSYNISEEDNEVSKGTGEIKKIQCPVLVINGKDDPLVPLEEAEKIKDLIGDRAQLKVFDCGHFAILHYPDEFVSLMNEFIS